MKFALVLCASVVTVASLLARGQSPATTESAQPITYNRDIAPLLYEHCTSCHRPGQGAPMSLLTYDQVRPWARAIRNQVAQRSMPPWFADRRVEHFANDPSLSDEEIDRITRWVTAGAPRGESPAPTPPEYAEGWGIGTPDLIVQNPNVVSLPASGVIDYVNVEIPIGIAEDRWVQAIEIRPSDRRVVHHALAFVRSPKPQGRALAPGPGGQLCNDDVCGEIEAHDPKSGVLFGAMAVGTPPEIYPEGTAKLLPGGSVLTLQIHYTTIGTPATDRIAVGLVFAKKPPSTPLKVVPLSKAGFVIPPRAPNHTIEASIRFQKDVRIHSIGPHAHLRGKSWSFTLVHPDGSSRPVLSVPRFDFNWQLVYRYSEPLWAPRGSQLKVATAYDNSADNPDNPDPNAEVRWGMFTNDEMLFAAVVYSVVPSATEAPGDPGLKNVKP